MNNKLAELIDLAKHIPEDYLDKAIADLKELKESADDERPTPPCPHCGSKVIVRDGRKHGKQRYLCRCCEKTYVSTTDTAIYYSHQGETVWKQVIRDTIAGIAIDKTAVELDLGHKTVFNMRHKILTVLSDEESRIPTTINGVCEADDTYVLESYKGKKIPDDYWRKARKHGAKAQSRASEHICICAATSREGGAIAMTVNRASPDKDDIYAVFSERVDNGALIICDGAKSYNILEKNGVCSVAHIPADKNDNTDSFYNINTTNGFHSFIKERYRAARGVATKYINRYNAIFDKAYNGSKYLSEEIFNKLRDMNNRFISIKSLKSHNLVEF
jgi:transposase-like protein